MTAKLRAFLRDTTGAAAIEYTLLAGLVALAVLVGMGSFAQSLRGMFNQVTETLLAQIPG